ncbi:MAG: transporter substrate-binding domain-containing protein, partial [Parvibaculaceae bacterium]|nr:transporter substrate-binding domain-containing protein [Parvibaculaceae bacterium]
MNLLLKINIAFLALLLLALGVMLEESPLHGVWQSGVVQMSEWFDGKSEGVKTELNAAEKKQSPDKVNPALVPIMTAETIGVEASKSNADEEGPIAGLGVTDPFVDLREDPAAPKPLKNPHRTVGGNPETPELSDVMLVPTADELIDAEERGKVENATSLVARAPLRIATEGNFPPFNFTNGDGKLAGFEVDLVQALCAQIKRECEIVPHPWASLLPGLIEGKWDLVMASMRIPNEAEAGVVYTKPYYRLPAQLVVRKGDVSNRRAPKPAGKEILVQSGSRHEAYVMQYFPEALRRSVPTFEEAWDRFALGEAMFFFGDRVAILQRMAGTQCCILAGDAIVDASFFSQGVGFALPA